MNGGPGEYARAVISGLTAPVFKARNVPSIRRVFALRVVAFDVARRPRRRGGRVAEGGGLLNR